MAPRHLHYFSPCLRRKTTRALPIAAPTNRIPTRNAACWQQFPSLLSLSNLEDQLQKKPPAPATLAAFHSPPPDRNLRSPVANEGERRLCFIWKQTTNSPRTVCVLLLPATLSTPFHLDGGTCCLLLSPNALKLCDLKCWRNVVN